MKTSKISNLKGKCHQPFIQSDTEISYTTPEIEIIEITTSQNILGGSLPSSEGEPWTS